MGKGNIVNYFKESGYDIIGSDILQGWDFLEYAPLPELYDVIITNPPYTLKDKFLERCCHLGKPFALLMPLTTLEGKRQYWLQYCGVEIILLDKRVKFETPSGKGKGSWFATAWFTSGLNLGKQLIFEELK